MSLFQAEIRNKVGMVEDSLTAKAFGVLDIISREALLKVFLEQFNIELTDDEAQQVKMKFWEWQGSTEPDVIIEGSDILIYIEAKLGSTLTEDQIISEYRDGIQKKKNNFHLIAITRDPLQPSCIDDARKALAKEINEVNLHWTRWQDLHSLLKKSLENLTENTDKKIVNQLIELFESQGLKTFDGFGEEVERVSLKSFNLFFENMSLFANEIASRSGLQFGRYIIRGYQSSVVDWYKNWFSSWISFSFWDEGWEQNVYNQISLHIDLSDEQPSISLAYEISFKDGWGINKFLLYDKVTELSKKVPTIDRLRVAFEESDYLMEKFDQEDFQEQLKHTQGGVSFYFDITLSDLRSTNILDNALSKLDQLKNFVNELGLIATSKEKDEYNKMKEQEKQEEPQ